MGFFVQHSSKGRTMFFLCVIYEIEHCWTLPLHRLHEVLQTLFGLRGHRHCILGTSVNKILTTLSSWCVQIAYQYDLFFLLAMIIEKKIVIRIKESTVLPNIKIKTKILVPPFKNQDQTNKNVLFDKM